MKDEEIELDEDGIIDKETRELIYKKAYQEACEFSEKYESSLSPNKWNPSRPADRSRYFASQRVDTIQYETAKIQNIAIRSKLSSMTPEDTVDKISKILPSNCEECGMCRNHQCYAEITKPVCSYRLMIARQILSVVTPSSSKFRVRMHNNEKYEGELGYIVRSLCNGKFEVCVYKDNAIIDLYSKDVEPC